MTVDFHRYRTAWEKYATIGPSLTYWKYYFYYTHKRGILSSGYFYPKKDFLFSSEKTCNLCVNIVQSYLQI